MEQNLLEKGYTRLENEEPPKSPIEDALETALAGMVFVTFILCGLAVVFGGITLLFSILGATDEDDRIKDLFARITCAICIAAFVIKSAFRSIKWYGITRTSVAVGMLGAMMLTVGCVLPIFLYPF